MTEFVKGLSSVADTVKEHTASYAERGARIAKRSRAIAASRLVEARAPERMRPRTDDGFVAGVHFAGDADSVYQLEQWLGPFEGLAHHLTSELGMRDPLGILCRSAEHAQRIEALTELPVRFSRLSAGLSTFMKQPTLRAVFYVNQSMRNFQALRFAEPAHIHLSHGESEKISMISNQLKAYDWVFTAGEAARERISRTLIGMPESRMMDVGRPQLDEARSVPQEWLSSETAASSGPILFVAPTWEGDSPSMAYGTVATSGVSMLTSLLAAGYRVIYRPHPRTGVVSQVARRARTECEKLVEQHPCGFLDATPNVSWQLDVADAAICEMSSVAFDWLSTGRPLIMVRPVDSRAEILEGGLFDLTPSIEPGRMSCIDALVSDALIDSSAARTIAAELASRYLGPTGPGQQQRRFEEASLWAIRLRAERKA